MRLEKLENIASIQIGKTPKRAETKYWGKGHPWVSISDLKEHIIISTKEEITDLAVKECGCKMIPKDTLLMSFKLSIGKLAFAGTDLFTNEAICGLQIKNPKQVDPNYLYYALKNTKLVGSNVAVKGATLNTASLKALRVPLAEDISTQLHIANILSKAENLIAQRKESIALLDGFLKSTFLEMFGNPVRNEKGWEISSLADFGSFKNGLNYTRNESGMSVRCLGVGDFKALSKLTDIESLQMLNLSTAPSKEYFLQNGDLVFVRSNGNRELVGRCLVIYPERNKVTFSGFCIRYRANDDSINTIYLSHLFRIPIFRISMLQNGKGANIQNINQKVLGELKIPTPPIELQTEFAQIVEKTEALKTQYQQSLQELEHLYGSLSQRAFKGELKLNEKEESVRVATKPEVQYQAQNQLSIPANKKGFAKLVLAGKIINECKDSPEFTNIKFQKLQHLAEHLMEADLNLNYYNQAAGPYDNKFMHTLHDKMNQQKWFASRGYKYSPLEKSNEIDGHFSRYFGNDNEQFSKLIKLLGKASEDQCEIISTLYAAWNDRIIKKEPITNEAIVQDFFNWSDRKQKYTSRQLTKAIEWMKENGLEPKGFGELIKHAKKKKKNN